VFVKVKNHWSKGTVYLGYRVSHLFGHIRNLAKANVCFFILKTLVNGTWNTTRCLWQHSPQPGYQEDYLLHMLPTVFKGISAPLNNQLYKSNRRYETIEQVTSEQKTKCLRLPAILRNSAAVSR